jgi:hypothetical protein
MQSGINSVRIALAIVSLCLMQRVAAYAPFPENIYAIQEGGQTLWRESPNRNHWQKVDVSLQIYNRQTGTVVPLYLPLGKDRKLEKVATNSSAVFIIVSEFVSQAQMTSRDVYRCDEPCNGNFKFTWGSLENMAVSNNEIWGASYDGTIWKARLHGARDWIQAGKDHLTARQPFAPGPTYVWRGLGYMLGAPDPSALSFTPAFCRQPCNGDWRTVDGVITDLAVSGEFVWSLNVSGDLWRRPVDGTGAWTLVARGTNSDGRYYKLAAGKLWLYALHADGTVSKCRQPCDKGTFYKVNPPRPTAPRFSDIAAH